MTTSLIQNSDQRIIQTPNAPEVSSHPLECRAPSAMGNGTRFVRGKSRTFGAANARNRRLIGSAHILLRLAQECAMSNISIERKTASRSKTVKTVETGC
jgi:hypothetical protein